MRGAAGDPRTRSLPPPSATGSIWSSVSLARSASSGSSAAPTPSLSAGVQAYANTLIVTRRIPSRSCGIKVRTPSIWRGLGLSWFGDSQHQRSARRGKSSASSREMPSTVAMSSAGSRRRLTTKSVAEGGRASCQDQCRGFLPLPPHAHLGTRGAHAGDGRKRWARHGSKRHQHQRGRVLAQVDLSRPSANTSSSRPTPALPFSTPRCGSGPGPRWVNPRAPRPGPCHRR